MPEKFFIPVLTFEKSSNMPKNKLARNVKVKPAKKHLSHFISCILILKTWVSVNRSDTKCNARLTCFWARADDRSAFDRRQIQDYQ